MQHFFSPSPAIEKKIAESAFFHAKIKNLSWNRWIYEPMGAKHQKLLLGNNAPGKCLQAHMQHFFSPSPAIEKKFAESHLSTVEFSSQYKNQKLVMKPWEFTSQWGQNTKNYSWATMPLASAFTPTCNISSALSPAIEKKFAESAFFSKNQKLVMKPLNLRANGGKTPKTTPGQQCPWQVPSCPHATFLHP